MLQLIKRARRHAERVAVVSGGESHRYDELLAASQRLAHLLLAGKSDLAEERMAFMVTPGFDYVRVQWAIWLAGGVAVPLCLSHPLPSLQYLIEDTGAETLVVSPECEEMLAGLAQERSMRLIVLPGGDTAPAVTMPEVDPQRRAMILYTSGTTSRPKGVVSTHSNIEAQIAALVQAWEWRDSDRILCTLPLHHVHGIINVVSCSLWSGACCEFLTEFSPEGVFSAFQTGRVNVFMAVPTIYYKLIAAWEKLPAEERQILQERMRSFRLMVSGSAALPVTVMEKWRQVSGHTLLERYGMTEIGMALSNSLRGERRPGFVGLPLPGVEVRLADEAGHDTRPGEPGEILVRGAGVFREYWNRPEATRDAFTPEGWFRTGDVAVVEDGYYRILGRNSVDIIKSGGYKISALEIEEVLRIHPAVRDCGVVGIQDEEWGELVAAALVPHEDVIDTDEIGRWLRERLPSYKIPRRWAVAADLPRNAMGKVTKNDLKKMFTG